MLLPNLTAVSFDSSDAYLAAAVVSAWPGCLMLIAYAHLCCLDLLDLVVVMCKSQVYDLASFDLHQA